MVLCVGCGEGEQALIMQRRMGYTYGIMKRSTYLGATQFYLIPINSPFQSFESIQLTTQVASPGIESIQLIN